MKGFTACGMHLWSGVVGIVAFSDLPTPSQSVTATIERTFLAMKFINGRLRYGMIN